MIKLYPEKKNKSYLQPPQITQVRPMQQRLNTLPTAARKASETTFAEDFSAW